MLLSYFFRSNILIINFIIIKILTYYISNSIILSYLIFISFKSLSILSLFAISHFSQSLLRPGFAALFKRFNTHLTRFLFSPQRGITSVTHAMAANSSNSYLMLSNSCLSLKSAERTFKATWAPHISEKGYSLRNMKGELLPVLHLPVIRHQQLVALRFLCVHPGDGAWLHRQGSLTQITGTNLIEMTKYKYTKLCFDSNL